jgi:hypothetical protein
MCKVAAGSRKAATSSTALKAGCTWSGVRRSTRIAVDQVASSRVTQAKTREAWLVLARVITVTPSQVARIAVTTCAPISSCASIGFAGPSRRRVEWRRP